jgi:guanylate kinase
MTKRKLPETSKVLVFIGPSGVGKSTIVRSLVGTGALELTRTWTDREPRAGENEIEHEFVSPVEFDELTRKGFFAHEPITLFGLPYRYAMPWILQPAPNKIPGVMSRVMALKTLNQLYPNRLIYQIEAPKDLVAERLLARHSHGVPLGSRLRDYESEIKAGRRIAHRIFTNIDSLESLLAKMLTAISQDFE